MACSSRGRSLRVENHWKRAVPAVLARKGGASRLSVQGQGRGGSGRAMGRCACCGQGTRFAAFY